MSAIDHNLLGVCTLRMEDLTFLHSLLTEYFGDHLKIVSIDGAKPASLPRDPKIILCSIHTLDLATEHYPESRILQMQRIITGRNLEEVIKLRSDKPVLVTNNSKTLAEETVNNLYSLGISHLEFVPYWHGRDLDLSRYDTVIYAGIREHIPMGNFQHINIGSRGVALPTLFEILQMYDLPFSLANRFLVNYRKSLVDSCYRIDESLRKMRKLKDKFERVCDSSTNVEVGIDRQGVIQSFNRRAESLFNISKERAMGSLYAECLGADKELLTLLDRREDIQDEFVPIHGKHCLVNISLLRMEGNIDALLTVTPIQELQKVEAKARFSLQGKGFVTRHQFSDIRGRSEVIRRTVDMARLYAVTDATVLLTGESGTGKELFAQAIHNASSRADGPFVGVNLAAMPETLAESEMFGYVEGAFTGAMRGGKAGLFEVAHGGTIFFDEIGDMSPSVQSKLLRVLEERNVIRVGGTSMLPINVRIICATNRPLEAMVRQGQFKEDLYYRIRVLSLQIPPLRDRKEDIDDILRAWGKINHLLDLLPQNTFERLRKHSWPGNIRELKSIMEYLSLLDQHRAHRDFLQKAPRLAKELLDHFFRDNDSGAEAEPSAWEHDIDPLDVEIMQQIALLQKQNKSTGRYSLAEQANLKEKGLSVTMLRTRIRKLAQAGYVTVGKTRQGASLSPKAIPFLKNHP